MVLGWMLSVDVWSTYQMAIDIDGRHRGRRTRRRRRRRVAISGECDASLRRAVSMVFTC
jgi:hypothetical protein